MRTDFGVCAVSEPNGGREAVGRKVQPTPVPYVSRRRRISSWLRPKRTSGGIRKYSFRDSCSSSDGHSWGRTTAHSEDDEYIACAGRPLPMVQVAPLEPTSSPGSSA